MSRYPNLTLFYHNTAPGKQRALVPPSWMARSSIINSFSCEGSCFAAGICDLGFHLRCRRVPIAAAGSYPSSSSFSMESWVTSAALQTVAVAIRPSCRQSFRQTEGIFQPKSGAVLNSLCAVSPVNWRVQPPYP